MKITDTTDRSQTESVWFEFELEHPPEKVWRALTEPELLSGWLLPIADLELVPGAEFVFRTQPHPGWDGRVHCRLIEADEHRRLSYTWVAGDIDTVITFTLDRTDAGTRVHLVQSGFRTDQKQNFGGARYGWRMMGGRLVDLLGSMT